MEPVNGEYFFIWLVYTLVCGYMAKVVASKSDMLKDVSNPGVTAFSMVVVSMLGGIVPTVFVLGVLGKLMEWAFGTSF